jgi:hypothetical protein
MVRERNAANAALVVAVITLSQWPVVDSSPLQLTIFLYGGVLVTALGIFERVRASESWDQFGYYSSCGGCMSLSEGFPGSISWSSSVRMARSNRRPLPARVRFVGHIQRCDR